MYEFRINFENRTCYGDRYTVWWWNQGDYRTIIDKIYYADSRREIIDMIKNEVRTRFGIKRAKWVIK